MERETSLSWDSFISAAQLSDKLSAILEDRGLTSPNEIIEFSKTEGMEVSELIDKTIYASHLAPSEHSLVSAKWMISYGFTPNSSILVSVHVTKEAIAP